MRDAWPDRGPKAVDATGVDDVALLGVLQHRQKRAGAVIDAAQQMLNVRSHSSRLLVTMLPPPLIPALLNNRWILSVWWRSATSSRNRSTCVRLATSAMCVVTRSPCGNPAASHSLCVSARPVGETSHVATLQASATSWRISSRPIPLPPPVITAVLPTNSVMCVLPCLPQPTLSAGGWVKGSP